MKTRQFKKGEVIFREWSLGNEMYEIKSGSVGVYANYGTDGETMMTELGAGRIFGELSALDLEPRSATAVALADTEAAEIGFADLRRYFEEEPGRVLEIMRSISGRLRELTDDYMDVCATVRELEKLRATGEEKGKGLLARIKRFMRDYNEAQMTMAQLGVDTTGGYFGGYFGT